MKSLMKLAVIAGLIAIVSSNTAHAGLWLSSGGQKTQQDVELSSAIQNANWANVKKLLMAGANPNAKIDNTALFVHAFEYSLKRDENNKISGIDSGRSDIARALAFAGGDIKQLERDLPYYLDADGKPIKGRFDSPKAEKDFDTFITHLRNIAADRKK